MIIIAANTIDKVYLFYGKPTASSAASGTNTFEFFDDFNSSFLNTVNWTKCGLGNAVVAGGELNLQSSSSATNVSVKTNATFSGVNRMEAYVNSVNNGKAILGEVNSSYDGYGLTYEQLVTSNKVMRITQISTNNTTDTCLLAADQAPVANTVLAGQTQGLWSFVWTDAITQQLTWPGGTITRNDTNLQAIQSQNMSFILANLEKAGSVGVDYVRVRKYTAIDPILTLGPETELIDEVWANNTGPYCQGATIELSAPFFTGATYQWFGPNGYQSTDQNPTISNASPNNTGTYVVVVSIPSGCTPQSDSTSVTVDPTTVSGTMSGNTTVCEAGNSGTLTLSGKTGAVQYWETALAIGGPWSTLANVSTTYDFEDIVNTTYYRAIVKSGVCPADTSNHQLVTVDQVSLGGNVMGSTDVCFGVNNDTLLLINRRGNIQKWQSTTNGTSWTDITNTNAVQQYTNLNQTTWYRVEVKNGVCPAVLSDVAQILINPKPVAAFSTNTPCEGFATNFTNNSSVASGSLVSHYWNFSDGTGSSLINPSHTFASATSYNVMLAIATDKGCVDTIYQNVSVNPLPMVDFSFTNVCDTLPMPFQNLSSPGTYQWNFGETGASSTSTNPQHTYAADGNYTVQLITTAGTGCVDSISKQVTVWPRAWVEFVSDSACMGTPIQFTNNTNFPVTDVVYTWQFGDGTNGTGVNPMHTYQTEGQFTVTLQSTTNNGCLDFTTEVVEMWPNPVAAFTVDNECKVDTVHFNNQSTITTGTMSYTWDLSGNVTSSLTNPSRLYSHPNDYQIHLDVVSDKGCMDNTSSWITVYPQPTANFTFDNVCDLLPMYFQSGSTVPYGSITHAWNFDDPTSPDFLSTEVNPFHIYWEDGLHEVELVVTSDFGCQDSITKTVRVYPLPQTDFTFVEQCDGFAIPFTNQTTISYGDIYRYTWNFDDAVTSLEVDPTHLFLNPGIYQVNLLAESDNYCRYDTTLAVEVFEVPVANFSVEDLCIGVEIQTQNQSILNSGIMTYAWAFGDGDSSDVTDPAHLYALPGFYPINLVATSVHNCIDSVMKYVEIYRLPDVYAGEDTSVSEGFEVPIAVTSNPEAASIFWEPSYGLSDNSIANPIADPLRSTTYVATVIDINGCENSDDVKVTVINDFLLYVQNIITPDGNGQNDTWVIVNGETFGGLNINVYDRTGTEVFKHYGNYNSDWAATMNNDILPDGSYYYVISFDISDKVYQGAITVLRNK